MAATDYRLMFNNESVMRGKRMILLRVKRMADSLTALLKKLAKFLFRKFHNVIKCSKINVHVSFNTRAKTYSIEDKANLI